MTRTFSAYAFILQKINCIIIYLNLACSHGYLYSMIYVLMTWQKFRIFKMLFYGLWNTLKTECDRAPNRKSGTKYLHFMDLEYFKNIIGLRMA